MVAFRLGLSGFGELSPRLPPDLIARAVTTDIHEPARASRALSGAVATDGRVLIVTITSDDLAWAHRIWLSIRAHRAD
jgi:hypothetical protein